MTLFSNRVKCNLLWVGLSLCLGLYATNGWSQDVNTIHIEASGTDTENCNALRNTLAGLTGGVKTVVILGPGTYDCGANVNTISESVSVIGSGRRSTLILGVFEIFRVAGGDVELANFRLIARATTPTDQVIGVVVGFPVAAGRTIIRDVRIEVSNGANNFGILGVECDGLRVENSVIINGSGEPNATAHGLNIQCTGANTIENVTVRSFGASSYALIFDTGTGSRLRASNSSFTALGGDVQATAVGTVTRELGTGTLAVVASYMEGVTAYASGPVFCLSDYALNPPAIITNGTFGSGGCL